MTVDHAELDRVLREVKRKYGDAVHSGDDEQDYGRVSTGSLELDYATGGGLPLGRCSHLWGGWSAGKSLMAWLVIKNAQKQHGMNAAYYNIEGVYDKKFVKRIGVDTSAKKLQVIDETTIEGVGTILENMLGAVNVHVIDSLAAAVSIDELGAKVEDWQIGLAARAWGKVLRRTNNRMDKHSNLVIMINHARDAFGSGGEHPPGGRFIEHQSACTVYFRRGKWLFYNGYGHLDPGAPSGPTVSGDMEADGYEIIARVNKSRVSRPLRTARLHWDYASASIDGLHELTKAAKYLNVFKETSPGRYELDDGTRIHGSRKLREAISNDQALQDRIRQTLLNLG